ncbi:hypothetical protein B296_00010435 [Ensete ventricosum]|uniref:Lunapark zinc ribbon domain-containing protein n=1 Tax=Ensete ventricosum TaxID=4639 RepID=A0A426YHY6_ENSVE|nr:hypothetical protein B296_00010435 [Ensete ventricosum]
MVVEETDTAAVVDPSKSSKGGTQPRRGVVSRLWRGIFGADDDYQKKLEHLSKEEASVHARLKRRAKSWVPKGGKKIPGDICASGHYTFFSTVDDKDQKTLERLRAERQAKIDELKEKTNYYNTQQLIQRYDLDPAAKAAAATVLACKLGADSGLKVHVGDESTLSTLGKSNDVELVQSSGLHNRKSMHMRGNSTGSSTTSQIMDKSLNEYDGDAHEIGSPDQRVVEHFRGSAFDDGGWLARIAALLVGEDPTQCYALICAHCHMHNGVMYAGLAKKEDFAYITYYCPHCHALNGGSRHSEEELGSNSGKNTPTSSLDGDAINHSKNNADSFTGNAVVSSLATVEEIRGGGTDENVIDKHDSESPASAQEIPEEVDEKELGKHSS